MLLWLVVYVSVSLITKCMMTPSKNTRVSKYYGSHSHSAAAAVRCSLFGAARHFLNLVVADSIIYLENALTAITSLYLREIDF